MGRNKGKAIMGRPPHEPTKVTRNTVEILVAAGLTQGEIAQKMGMDRKTLVRHYEHELNVGWANAIHDAAAVILSKMREENGADQLDAAKFFLTRRGKGLWTEVKQMELSGPNGAAMQVASKVDLDAIEFEDLETVYEILSPAVIAAAESEYSDDDSDDDSSHQGA